MFVFVCMLRFTVELLRFPSQHTSVVVLCNVAQAAPSVRADRVADIVLANVLAPVSEKAQKKDQVPVPADVLQKYVGVYKSEKEAYQRVELKGGKLTLANFGVELIPQSSTVFRTNVTEGTITFSENKMVFGLFEDKLENYVLIHTTAPNDLSVFVGDYYSPELDATWQLRVQEGQLTAHVKHSDNPAMTLRAVAEDTFTLEGGSFHFERKAGKLSRVLLTVDRIRNIEFVRTP